jgi:hypothetical protein
MVATTASDNDFPMPAEFPLRFVQFAEKLNLGAQNREV